MRRVANRALKSAVGLFAWAFPAMAWGALLTPDNILVSAGDKSSPTNRVYEYTPAGGLVQSFAVPSPTPNDQNLHDIVAGPDDKVYIFNGTFSPYLTVLNPATAAYAHHQGVGFSTVGNVAYGGVAVINNYAFVSDMNTAGSTDKGIVRFDTADFASQRFATTKEYARVSIGADGLLYALTIDEPSGWPEAEVYNPNTLALVRSVVFRDNDIRAIAATAAGQMYCAGWDGTIYAYDTAGNIVASRDTGLNNVYDIDLSPDGKLVASDWGHIVLTDTTLATQTQWTLSNTGPLYVAFTSPVPEPASLALLLLGSIGLFVRRRRPARA